VDLTVHDPVSWTKGLTWTGNVDFGALNQAIADLKESDNAPNRSYYQSTRGAFGLPGDSVSSSSVFPLKTRPETSDLPLPDACAMLSTDARRGPGW
jgi:hypothetical protein